MAAALLGKVDAGNPPTFQAYFNRGFVMSQFMARYLNDNGLSVAAFKKQINDENENAIKEFLSGDLRKALLNQVAMAEKDGQEIYAALFELNEPALIAGLCKLGKNAHIVLANGAVKSRNDDENKEPEINRGLK